MHDDLLTVAHPGLPSAQNNKAPMIPADSQGFLVSCVTGKEALASREATQLLGQVRPRMNLHACRQSRLYG